MHANRVKHASGQKPVRITLDDSTGGLFGDGDSGHISGAITSGGKALATVFLREDGLVAFTVAGRIATNTGASGADDETLREKIDIGWRRDWQEVFQELSLAAESGYSDDEAPVEPSPPVAAAITALEVTRDTLETNEPINRAEGNDEQADLEAKSAEEVKQAIEVLKEVQGAAAGSADIAYLKDVTRGAHDATDLGELLAKIEAAVQALEAAGLLTGEADTVAGEAITHWVSLDEKANG